MTDPSSSIVPGLVDFISQMPSKVTSGDLLAVSLVLISIYLLVYLINKLTGLIIFLLKKVFLLVIVLLAFYRFMEDFMTKVGAEGFTQDNLVLGVAGTFVGFIATAIALYAALSSLKDIHISRTDGKKKEEEEVGAEPEEVESEKKEMKPGKEDSGLGLSNLLSVQSLKSDRHLGAVLAYLVIAEFGVFSSKTMAAPTPAVGVGFFAVFMVAALFFIRQSYSDYMKGLRHLGAAILFGGILSLILGHFWGGYPLEKLLSTAYFATDSLVALVTGLSVSLFMGSRS
ncbi:MAG: hypothetical protein GF416_01240 [Candidatus Altiarchaeales archaeon]|nr:hypothetical protein [Candidatus Altiarchaeales archaeon]MBD3415740.1 hypothetical protein [Candidatus Altiarchaeales archaeon]